MSDREKAIRILEGNYKDFVLRHNGELLTVNKLIALLKEQEITVQPERRYLSIDPHRDKYRCSRCGDLGLRYLQRFCGGCGKEVDWLDRI